MTDHPGLRGYLTTLGYDLPEPPDGPEREQYERGRELGVAEKERAERKRIEKELARG